MSVNVAINGFGRIGRNILRAVYETNREDKFKVVAINDLTDPQTLAHLLKYDSVHDKFKGEVKAVENCLIVNGDKIAVFGMRDPKELPWQDFNIDVVCECTGFFTDREKASSHLKAGALKVLISAPATDADATIVYGVNHKSIKPSDTIISNASCTTNCLTPLVKPLMDTIGIEKGLMITIHSYTNDQVLIDGPHSDIRRARGAACSMIPTKTGAAAAVGLVIPEMKGLLDGYAIRVPTVNVSIVDLTFEASRETSIDEINEVLLAASKGELKNILEFSKEPLVSIDFNHNPASSIYESLLTKVIGKNLVKVSSWYDNEWGFSNRMVDTTLVIMD